MGKGIVGLSAIATLTFAGISASPALELVKDGRPVAVIVTTLPLEQWPDRLAAGLNLDAIRSPSREGLRILAQNRTPFSGAPGKIDIWPNFRELDFALLSVPGP